MFETPILFLIFNRPNTTKQVFEVIRQIQPKYLFVGADGPRENKEGETELCEQARKIATSIDWECDVKTLFNDENLGCRNAVISAITWFFENVEMGIILEDDCLPDLSFFQFCEVLLIKFEQNTKIISISGHNLGYKYTDDNTYFFSRFMNIWGWATWRRSTLIVDYNLKMWKKTKNKNLFLYRLLSKNYFDIDINWIKYWKWAFNLIINGLDAWDWQWIFAQLQNKKYTIFPTTNLITNIGFNENATHTVNSNHIISSMKSTTFQFPIKHPSKIEINYDFENKCLKKIWCEVKFVSLKNYIKNKLLYIGIINKFNFFLKNILRFLKN
jgi:hypothetical protein